MFSTVKVAVLLTYIVLLLLIGCGTSVDSTSWLLITGGDTVSVGALGTAWNSLDSTQKAYFEDDENTMGEYIVAYGQRLVLEEELRAHGLLDDPKMVDRRNSWLMYRSGAAAKRILIAEQAEMVTDDDIAFYWNYLGKNVVYSLNPGDEQEEELMYAHLPDLPQHLVLLLDSLEIGEVGTDETGLQVRLENVTITDSILIRNALSDSSIVSQMAIKGISEDRYVRWARNRLTEVIDEYSIWVDDESLDSLPAVLLGEVEMPDQRIVIQSDFGDWSVADLNREISFINDFVRAQPHSQDWIRDFVDILIMQHYYHEMLLEESPAVMDSLEIAADRYLLQLAADIYYSEIIGSTIEVTQSDMEYEYENLSEPIIVEEKRSLRVALIPSQRMEEFESAVYSETLDEFIDELDGIHYLADDSLNTQFTRPLTFGQVPGGNGEEIFQLAPSDTSRWMGPFSTFADDDMVLIKLVEVHPARSATLEESLEQMRELATIRLAEQATLDLMRQLEEKHGLEVNEEILGDLPADPALWSNL